MEERIAQSEAEAEAATEMNREFQGDMLKERFAKLETEAGADIELLELKKKMGLVPPEPAGTPATRVAEVDKPAAVDDMAELEAALADLKARELGHE